MGVTVDFLLIAGYEPRRQVLFAFQFWVYRRQYMMSIESIGAAEHAPWYPLQLALTKSWLERGEEARKGGIDSVRWYSTIHIASIPPRESYSIPEYPLRLMI